MAGESGATVGMFGVHLNEALQLGHAPMVHIPSPFLTDQSITMEAVEVDRAFLAFYRAADQLIAAMALREHCLTQERAYREWRKTNEEPPRPPMRDLHSSWIELACREIAMCSHDLIKAADEVTATVKKAPAVAAFINQGRLKSSKKALRKLFPDAENVRDAAAHPEAYGRGDVKHTADQIGAHGGIYVEPGVSVSISGITLGSGPIDVSVAI